MYRSRSFLPAFLFAALLPLIALAQSAVAFEETFDGAQLDPLKWRTEILNSGPRWCDVYPGAGDVEARVRR